MKIYSITRGQLITIWVFGIIGFFVAIDYADYSGFASFITILIPALLIFYTIGWRSRNVVGGFQGFNFAKYIPSRKKILAIIASVLLIILSIYGVSYLNDERENSLKRQQLEKDYNQAILVVDSLKEQGRICVEPIVNKKFEEQLRSCNLLKNKIKHDYNFCVSLSSINSPASCLYDHDYEKIDCSEETMKEKSKTTLTYNDIPQSCHDIFSELVKVNSTIEEYSKLNP